MHPFVSSLSRLGVIAALGLSLVPAIAQGQPRQRSLYASLVDKRGVPVPNAGPDDFVVRENGVAREVLRVAPATEPMRLALLVDNSQAATRAVQFMRDGLGRFVNTLTAAGHSISFITLADRPTLEVDATTDGAQLKSKGVDRLFPRSGSGAYLLDAIIETARGFTKNEVERPVIVAVVTEGTEFSNASYQQVLEALTESGSAFHALVLTEGDPDRTSDEARNRNVVFDRGTREHGGRRETLISNLALPDALDKLAAELLAQVKVTYASPERLIPADKITIEARRRELTARGVPVRTPKP